MAAWETAEAVSHLRGNGERDEDLGGFAQPEPNVHDDDAGGLFPLRPRTSTDRAGWGQHRGALLGDVPATPGDILR